MWGEREQNKRETRGTERKGKMIYGERERVAKENRDEKTRRYIYIYIYIYRIYIYI